MEPSTEKEATAQRRSRPPSFLGFKLLRRCRIPNTNRILQKEDMRPYPHWSWMHKK
jgi:hypothetical protein